MVIGSVTSPKKQVNRRRLRLAAAQNLSFMGFRNTSPGSVGFFFQGNFSSPSKQSFPPDLFFVLFTFTRCYKYLFHCC